MFEGEKRMLPRHYLEQGSSKSALVRELGVSRDMIHRIRARSRWGSTRRRCGLRAPCRPKLDASKPIIEARQAAYPAAVGSASNP